MGVGRMNPRSLSETIKAYAKALGFDLVGIAPLKPPAHADFYAEWLKRGYAGEMAYLTRNQGRRQHPEEAMPWAKSVISVAMNYYAPFEEPREKGTRGWLSRYAWGEDYHEVLKERLLTLLELIRQEAPHVQGKAFVDISPILEREFAAQAGVGWVGKNTNVISPELGSFLFLGELFLDVELEYDRPIFDHCGECTLCLKACPTDAFVGPYTLDARRCISYLTIELRGSIPLELRPLLGEQIFGCDICQEVCPYNRKPIPTNEEAFQPRDGLSAPELTPLLALSEEEFRERFKGSPVKRAKRRGLARNVAVALGNLRCEEAVPALAHALKDPEALVRAHVAWALGRIGTEEAQLALAEALKEENDPEVIREIRLALGGEGESSGRPPQNEIGQLPDAADLCYTVSSEFIGGEW